MSCKVSEVFLFFSNTSINSILNVSNNTIINGNISCSSIYSSTDIFYSKTSLISTINNLKSSWMETDFLGLMSSLRGFVLSKHIHEDVYSIVVIEKSK